MLPRGHFVRSRELCRETFARRDCDGRVGQGEVGVRVGQDEVGVG